MIYTKRSLPILLAFSLVACAGSEREQSTRSPKVVAFDEKVETRPENQIARGNLYAIDRSGDSAAVSAGAGPALDEFEAVLKKKIEAAGYRATKNLKDAHLALAITALKQDYEKGGFSYLSQATGSPYAVEIKGGPVLLLNAYAYARSYGKRPVLVAQGSDRGALASFFQAAARAESFERFAEKFPVPRAVGPLDKRKPSCYPSFGFQASLLGSDSEVGKALIGSLLGEDDPHPAGDKYAVSFIVAKGPAEKAGLKVGDIIEAVDSLSYEKFAAADDRDHLAMYEEGKPVPLKFRRAGKLIRASMRPAMLCL